jgi:hypothetical protein
VVPVTAVAVATALAPDKNSRRLQGMVGMLAILRCYRISFGRLALKPLAGYREGHLAPATFQRVGSSDTPGDR